MRHMLAIRINAAMGRKINSELNGGNPDHRVRILCVGGSLLKEMVCSVIDTDHAVLTHAAGTIEALDIISNEIPDLIVHDSDGVDEALVQYGIKDAIRLYHAAESKPRESMQREIARMIPAFA